MAERTKAELDRGIEGRQNVEATDDENGGRENSPGERDPTATLDLGAAMGADTVNVFRKVIELVCAEVRHG